MKELYIFNVKEEFYKLYKKKPNELFFIYDRIYNMKKSDKEYGFNLFSQISVFLDKNYINNLINKKYKKELMYSYNNNQHIMNNLFLNEITILTVNNSNIKIESNVDNPFFLDVVKKLGSNYFVCDFFNKDCFFIDNLKLSKNILVD